MSFNLFLVVVLAGGWAAARLMAGARLPGILGMLLFGLGLGLVAEQQVPELAWSLDPIIKTLALIVILLRAGLAIKRRVLAESGRTAFLLAVIPCTLEALMLMPLLHYLLGFDWLVAGLTAWMLAAVSPAVVVPTMLDLQARKRGEKNQVPTLVMASASVDDVVAITFFGAFLVLATGSGSVTLGLALAPVSIVGGAVLGALTGAVLAWWLSRRGATMRLTEQVIMVLLVSILLVELGDALALASMLAVMALGLVLRERVESLALNIARGLGQLWIPLEILLFVLIGLQVDPTVALETGLWGLGIIVMGLLARTAGVWMVTALDGRFNRHERLFCAAAFVPKATVQAALGAVPLGLGIAGGEVILSLAVLAILTTAPLGLILIRHLGEKLP